jgi:hypothetical protein
LASFLLIVHFTSLEANMKNPFAKLAALLFVLSLATTALAGPPLICHSFDIGNAQSLPWISHDWRLSGAESYDVNHLVSDTIAILDADPTVLVHMETLRRATLYAQKDPLVAKRLLISLNSRADAAARTPGAALANFDLGYLAETYKQYEWISKSNNDPAHNFDGYARIQQALQLRPDDPQMNFAAALVTLDAPGSGQQGYAKKAFAGAASDPLLARNLATHFMSPQSETMSQMISRNSNVKVAQQ